MLILEYSNQYAAIVDNFEVTQGLNNFAEGALRLCSHNKNDSAKWESSFTAEKVLEMDSVKQLIKESKEFSEKYSEIVHEEPSQCVIRTGVNEVQTPTHLEVPTSMNRALNRFQTTSDSKEVSSINGAGESHLKTSVTPVSSSSSKPAAFTIIGGSFNRNTFQQSNNYLKFSEINNSNGRSCPLQQEFPSATDNYLNNNYTKTDPNNTGSDRFGAPQISRPFTKKPLFANSATQDNPPSRFSGEQFSNQRNKAKYWKSNGHDGDDDSEEANNSRGIDFRTAKEQLSVNNMKKYGRGGGGGGQVGPTSYGTGRKCLGTRRGLNSKFVPPVPNKDQENYDSDAPSRSSLKRPAAGNNEDNECTDERLKGIDPKIVELISNEIMDQGPSVTWDDIAGLEFAKKNIKEIVVWPMLRPDIFTGLRGPPKGLLLFGPPGTGKTLIGKCIASQSKSTFFSISASSLTSKWVGEGEKMVRALFAVSRCYQPAVIFIDEIDSLLSQRSDNEHESSRRIKTEFLIQLDGATTDSEERLLVIGATNRPQEIDEAARRRFVRRLYIPLPEKEARRTIIQNLLHKQQHYLSPEELDIICQKSDGYSGADMTNVCREAALGPIRSLSFGDIENITADQVRPIEFSDFEEALIYVKASVSSRDLDGYISWNDMFGSGGTLK